MELKILSKYFFIIVIMSSCKAQTNVLNEKENRNIYFSLQEKNSLHSNDLIILEMPKNKDGKFIENSVLNLIEYIKKQKKPVKISIHFRINSGSEFNMRYSVNLKKDLIKQITNSTSLEQNKDYKVKAFGSTENLMLLVNKNKFSEMSSRIEIQLID